MSSVNCHHNVDVVGKAFQQLPALDNLATFFISDSDTQQMEEQRAVLKLFRILSEEQNEDAMQGDAELSFNLKRNGDVSFEDALENSRDSLSYLILPREGEGITSNSAGRITSREAGNDSDMTEEERNNVNLTERQIVAVNTANSFTTRQEQNKMPDEHLDRVNGCSNEGCHISPDERAAEESLRAKCQHISTDCTNTDCDRVAPIRQDDAEEGIQSVRKEYENVHDKEDFVTSTSNSDVGFDSEESVENRPVPHEVNEEEEDEEEKRDVFPDFSAQSHHPPSPKDTSPNIFIASAANSPPPGSTFTRATFSPGSPTDKQNQLPALFSGLRVLRKGVVGPEHDTVAQIKPSSHGARRDIFPETQEDAKVRGSFLDQISHLLKREKRGDENEEKDVEAEGDEGDAGEENEIEESQEGERKEVETDEDAEVSFESAKPSVSSAEAAFDAFKAFFTPKPLKKDPAEKLDLEAVRKRIRTDKDVLRALFERTANKTPEKKGSPDGKVRSCVTQHRATNI